MLLVIPVIPAPVTTKPPPPVEFIEEDAKAVVVVALIPIFPLNVRDTPVAAPMFGVTKVGVFERTTPPEPVGVAVTPVPPEVAGRAVPDKVIASVPDEVIGEPEIERNAMVSFQRLLGTDAATEVTVPVPGAAGVCHTSEVPFEVKTWFTVPTVVRPVPPEVVGRAVPERVIASVPAAVMGEPVMERNDGTDAATEVTVPDPIVVHKSDEPSDVRTCPFDPTVVRPVPPLPVGSAVPESVIASVPTVVIGEPETERNEGTDAATEVTPVAAGVCHTSEVPFEVKTWFTVPTVVRPVPPEDAIAG